MRELIGQCVSCGENIYCESGFFDGASIEGQLFCNQCVSESKKELDSY